jgi:hypothetical protein
MTKMGIICNKLSPCRAEVRPRQKEEEASPSPKKLVISPAEVESLQLAEDFDLPHSVLGNMLRLIEQAAVRAFRLNSTSLFQ